MRIKIKPLLGALLVLLALSALASASASASTCKKGSSEAEHKALCVEGQQVGSSSKTVTTSAAVKLKTGTSVVFKSTAGGWGATCSGLRTAGVPVIESGGGGNVKLASLAFTFQGCQITGSEEDKKCEVFSFYTENLSSSLTLPETVLSSGLSNQRFGEIAIRGGTGCSVSFEGDYLFYGTEVCSLKLPEVEAVAKELVCEAKSSKLEFRHGQGGAVTLALEGNIELAGEAKGKKFSITK